MGDHTLSWEITHFAREKTRSLSALVAGTAKKQRAMTTKQGKVLACSDHNLRMAVLASSTFSAR